MTHLAFGLVALWFCGLTFFAARALNLTRLALNNLAPGESYLGSAHLNPFSIGYRLDGTAVDPGQLTELGRQYRKRAIWKLRLMISWGIGVFLLAAGFLSYVQK